MASIIIDSLKVEADQAPGSFAMKKAKGGVETAGHMYRMQVPLEDCVGKNSKIERTARTGRNRNLEFNYYWKTSRPKNTTPEHY